LTNFNTSAIKFSKVGDVVVFWYQKSGDTTGSFVHFGVLQGTKAFFFKDGSGDLYRWSAPLALSSENLFVCIYSDEIFFFTQYGYSRKIFSTIWRMHSGLAVGGGKIRQMRRYLDKSVNTITTNGF
jgi:hypothetical protein